ncbi:MAG: hypothetical protein B9S33_01835 [Pedosphaera sp. Tous-C6FEB]|nr:MAG: hypothetical protein B9S33_01835 [Pedosphaera sp. Tous-C6FEB]
MHHPFCHRTSCALLLLVPLTLSAFGQGKEQIVTVTDAPPAMFIAVGDLNGDGRADIALVEAPPTKPQTSTPVFRLHLIFQKDRKFAMPADKIIALGATTPSGLAIGDFDGDGRYDLAVGLRVERSLSLFLGSESFEKEHRSRYGNDTGAGGVSTGRVNKSGRADFLTGAAWRQWQGNDRFGEAYFAGPQRNDNWRSTLADMDRNGTDDVIFTTYTSTKLDVPSNNRVRIFYGPFLKMQILQPADAAQVVTLNSPFMASDKPLLGTVMAGDLNDDSQLDLVVPAAGKTLVYHQNSPTGFSENANPTFVIEDATPLLVTDLNGDKLCDIAFLPTNEASITLWYQQKDKPLTADSLAACPRVAIPKMTGVVASGDLDGDGRLEIIVGLSGGGLAIVSLPRR